MSLEKYLTGKTITRAMVMKRKGYDDTGWLRLEFSDGSVRTLVAYYDDFTGESEGEYPTRIALATSTEDLVPAEV